MSYFQTTTSELMPLSNYLKLVLIVVTTLAQNFTLISTKMITMSSIITLKSSSDDIFSSPSAC